MKFEIEVSAETVRKAIKHELKYSYKKTYFRSYKKDDEKIKQARFWIAFELFATGYFENKYIVWMDETSINNTSFK